MPLNSLLKLDQLFFSIVILEPIMSYTQSDLTNVKNAIIALATGTRVVRVSIGDKLIEYSQTKLNELKALRGEIQTELQSSQKYGFVLTRTGKGL